MIMMVGKFLIVTKWSDRPSFWPWCIFTRFLPTFQPNLWPSPPPLSSPVVGESKSRMPPTFLRLNDDPSVTRGTPISLFTSTLWWCWWWIAAGQRSIVIVFRPHRSHNWAMLTIHLAVRTGWKEWPEGKPPMILQFPQLFALFTPFFVSFLPLLAFSLTQHVSSSGGLC